MCLGSIKQKKRKSLCTVCYLGVCFAKWSSKFRSFLGLERLIKRLLELRSMHLRSILDSGVINHL